MKPDLKEPYFYRLCMNPTYEHIDSFVDGFRKISDYSSSGIDLDKFIGMTVEEVGQISELKKDKYLYFIMGDKIMSPGFQHSQYIRYYYEIDIEKHKNEFLTDVIVNALDTEIREKPLKGSFLNRARIFFEQYTNRDYNDFPKGAENYKFGMCKDPKENIFPRKDDFINGTQELRLYINEEQIIDFQKVVGLTIDELGSISYLRNNSDGPYIYFVMYDFFSEHVSGSRILEQSYLRYYYEIDLRDQEIQDMLIEDYIAKVLQSECMMHRFNGSFMNRTKTFIKRYTGLDINKIL